MSAIPPLLISEIRSLLAVAEESIRVAERGGTSRQPDLDAFASIRTFLTVALTGSRSAPRIPHPSTHEFPTIDLVTTLLNEVNWNIPTLLTDARVALAVAAYRMKPYLQAEVF